MFVICEPWKTFVYAPNSSSYNMASNTKKKVFGSEDALAMVEELRAAFDCGKTRGCEWRISQLKALIKLSEEHEKEIVQALHSDLSKSETEAFVQEVLNLSPNYN
ncbi:hypothetical protein VIGAN_03188500 [Vigna angularis var. angularis]|uniref:Aldehyde dehydrogenase domain-containing protein n=1 Tax=Vigna angularis var. angularis TaxID=157739 RepID=A0A0S3RN09_PHAAN|nr:hypothetical protein VIGAN_03188500 [Vigna angularis var. angularis]